MKRDEIARVLDDHRKWLTGGGGSHADLRDADLCDADLRGANLDGADLRHALLRCALLCNADLRGVDLCYSDLRDADLRDADLRGVNLDGALLRGALLCNADLLGVDLSSANLRGADLSGANLCGATLPEFQIPQDGTLTVYKAISGVVVKLLIPTRAKRTTSPVGRKCRAEYAKVLSIDGGRKEITGGRANMTYRVGETVRADSYDDDIRVECTHGIHFFLTREEAEEY